MVRVHMKVGVEVLRCEGRLSCPPAVGPCTLTPAMAFLGLCTPYTLNPATEFLPFGHEREDLIWRLKLSAHRVEN